MSRITVTLTPNEKAGLISLAEKELRDPRFQATLIIRQELVRCGLLSEEQSIEHLSIRKPELSKPVR